MSWRAAWLYLALGLVWGLPYLLIRVAVADLPPVLVAVGRTAVGALVLLPLAMAHGALRPALRRWKAVAAFALVEIVGPWWLLGYAETHISSATAGLLIATVPVLSAGLLVVGGREALHARRAAGLALGLLGVVALVGFDGAPVHGWALGAALLSALGYAVGPIVVSERLAGVPPLGVIALSLAMATVLYLPFAAWARPVAPGWRAAGAVLALGLVCTALAFVLFFALIAEVGPARATVVAYLNPVVAVLLGALFLDERVTPGMLIGLAMVLAGSLLATARATRPVPRRGAGTASPRSGA